MRGSRTRGLRRVAVATILAVGCGSGDGAGESPQTAVPSWPGSFERRWTSDVEGQLIGLQTSDQRIYAATLNGSQLGIVAFDVSNGSALWERQLAKVTKPDFWASPTEPGLLVTFDDAAGGHLALLDVDTGKSVWDVHLDNAAYDVYEQLTDELALINITEYELEFVDLSTGDRTSAEKPWTWMVAGEDLPRLSDGSLEVGWDPFDPDRPPASTIELPYAEPRIGSSPDGSVLVASDDSEITGIVDGEEVWTWRPDLSKLGDVRVFEGYVGVEESSDFDTNVRWAQFARLGDDGVKPLQVLPATFELTAVLPGEEGDASLVGFLDESPVDSSDELVAVATIELTEGLPVHEIKDSVDAMGEVGAFGSYVFAASPYGEHIQVYAGVQLTPVATLPFPAKSTVATVTNGLVIYDEQRSTISLHA